MALKLLCRTTMPGHPQEMLQKAATAARGVLAYIFVWCCLVKLPATAMRDSPPESYEPVLSYAAAHHLQWGSDIVFTYGPLGFLTSDYYWGNFFFPIVIWAGVFALAMTIALVPLMSKLPGAIRLALYAALPLLTVPTCLDLGFDPIRILCITVLGIGCLPGERPRPLRLITTGLILTVLSLTKFTYCIYSAYTVIIIAASNRNACWRNTVVLAGSSLLSLLAICLWRGQNIASICLHITRSFQMTLGYSAAMALPGMALDLIVGVILLILLVALVLITWLGSSNWRPRTDRAAIVAAGIFLAWKEGFTRAEVHVMVFFVDALFFAALLPALLEQPDNPRAHEQLNGGAASVTSTTAGTREQLKGCVPALSAACILISFAQLVVYHKEFKAAVRDGLVARNRNTLTAFSQPATFKHELERYLAARCQEADLPEIRAMVGRSTVDAMNLDQEVVILNDLNYAPHPVFENYAAYTPGLQRLNSQFFNSQKAPEYLLWHTGSIDGRFPTLDDGEALLRILKTYSPVAEEKGYLLWKRKSRVENSYCLSDERESHASLNQWVPIPREPTWLRIECGQTFFGAIRSLLCRPSQLRLEAQLDDGETRDYRLLAGNARYGFVISPFLRADYQLIEAARPLRESPAEPTALPKTYSGEPPRMVAIRVRAGNNFAYKHHIRFVTQTIQGIWPVHGQSLPIDSNEISKAR